MHRMQKCLGSFLILWLNDHIIRIRTLKKQFILSNIETFGGNHPVKFLKIYLYRADHSHFNLKMSNKFFLTFFVV